MKNSTDAMKESRVPDFLASVGALTTAMKTGSYFSLFFFFFNFIAKLGSLSMVAA